MCQHAAWVFVLGAATDSFNHNQIRAQTMKHKDYHWAFFKPASLLSAKLLRYYEFMHPAKEVLSQTELLPVYGLGFSQHEMDQRDWSWDGGYRDRFYATAQGEPVATVIPAFNPFGFVEVNKSS